MNKYLLFTLNIAILTACSQKPHPIAELFKDYQGEKVVYHTGSSTSFRNIFYRIPTTQISIIILTNRNEPEEESMVDLAERVLEGFYKEWGSTL